MKVGEMVGMKGFKMIEPIDPYQWNWSNGPVIWIIAPKFAFRPYIHISRKEPLAISNKVSFKNAYWCESTSLAIESYQSQNIDFEYTKYTKSEDGETYILTNNLTEEKEVDTKSARFLMALNNISKPEEEYVISYRFGYCSFCSISIKIIDSMTCTVCSRHLNVI